MPDIRGGIKARTFYKLLYDSTTRAHYRELLRDPDLWIKGLLDAGHFPAALELKAGQESGVTTPERIAEAKTFKLAERLAGVYCE